MKHSIYSIFWFVILLACSRDKIVEKTTFKTFVTDTALTHQKLNELDFSIQRCKDFNLPQIHTGVDSFELRIWVSGMTNPAQLFILRHTNSGWNFFKYYYYSGSEKIDSILSYSQEIPANIGSLVKYLQEQKIQELPSQAAIPEFIDNVNDGQTCIVEIATQEFYKALQYHCPEHFAEKNHRQFMVLVNTVNRYFQFYNPWCKPVP